MSENTPPERRVGVVDTSHSPHARLRSVPPAAVTLGDGFWRPRVAANVTTGMPTFFHALEEHGVLDNFRRLSGRKEGEYREAGYASESDLYKWLEAVGYVLQTGTAPDLRALAEAAIDEIAAAQAPDGYLYAGTAVGGDRDYERFSQLEHSHELYCAGHLMQAGVAYWRATGDGKLLGVATRLADYLGATFGPGKLETTDGHPEVELALIELYRATGERRYLDLAGVFLSRPQSFDNLPPIAQRPALVGHAVRSGYLCCGGADWYLETGDTALLDNLRRLWQDLVGGKIYLTGGVGARFSGEAFGEPYELPNARAYAETCAAIAHAMWAWRMLLATGEAQYADWLETILYNGFLSGVSLGGAEYFYMNPLASPAGYRRQPWFGCNCCPPNIHRTLAALPGYLFTTSEEGVWVHLYDACEALLTLPDRTLVRLEVRTHYPWEGEIEIVVTPPVEAEFTVFLRIPSWSEGAQVTVNGEPHPLPPLLAGEGVQTGYFPLRRRWAPGDVLRLELPLPVRLVESHPRVPENRGAVALTRGPLVYCLESPDNVTAEIPDLALAPAEGDASGGFCAEWQPLLLRGVALVRGRAQGLCARCIASRPDPLYRVWGETPAPPHYEVPVTAIPYYAWANRESAAMTVWAPVAATGSSVPVSCTLAEHHAGEHGH
jgi:DUF1680 family protein